LLVEGYVNSTDEGLDLARDAISSGDALDKLEEIIKVSNELKD